MVSETLNYIRRGEIITENSFQDPTGRSREYAITKVLSDGSRFRIDHRRITLGTDLSQYVGWIYGSYGDWNPLEEDQGHDPVSYAFYPGNPTRHTEEPVNAAPTFFDIRDHLATAAHEVLADYNPQWELYDSQRNSFLPDTPISDRALLHNKLYLEAMRKLIGWHWRNAHQLTEIIPTADNTVAWKAMETVIKASHDNMCRSCEERAWAMRVLEEIPVEAVQTMLDDGKIFYFDVDTDPWTVVEEPGGSTPFGKYEQLTALDDYRLARSHYWHGVRPDFFPTGILSEVSSLYNRQRRIMRMLRTNYGAMELAYGARVYPDARTSLGVYRQYAKFLYQNILALIRPENYNEEALAKIEANAGINTVAFVAIAPSFDTILGLDEHWTRRGFIRYQDQDDGRFIRDDNGDSTINIEGDRNMVGDQRRGTITVLVMERELDAGSPGYERTWLNEGSWSRAISVELGRPGDF